MRKRAQLKMPESETTRPQSLQHEEKRVRRQFRINKNWWVSISLIAIFLLVLFLNSYFNIISNTNINPEGTTLSDKFYVSGPDPYYNLRLVDHTLQTGQYPYYAGTDPLLNYPLGQSGGRAPLLVMSALGFSRFLVPFMSEIDAVGYSIQFMPALFGALLIFPVYFLGKTLFGRKEGLLAAFFIALIPIHISSGHGSAYGLFDHDSFNLLIFFTAFMFLIYSIKEKDRTRSLLYALLGGTSLAALSLVWVEAQFLYAIIAIYAIVQILFDIISKKVNLKFAMQVVIILLVGYLVPLPVLMTRGIIFTLSLFITLGIVVFSLFYFYLEKKKIPWIISLPAIFGTGAIVLIFLSVARNFIATIPYLSSLNRISDIISGIGIYGNKVALTIAEAHTSNISNTVMSYGPAIYWLAWAGFVFLVYQYAKQKWRKDYLFVLILFIINIWLSGIAGRFLNDVVPVIALLAAWITIFLISKIDYKQMVRNIRNAGGGFRGLRKGIHIYHLLGILFVAVLIILPNGYLALDAAVPRGVITKDGNSTMKRDYLGIPDDQSAFGSGSGKEQYWIDALSWLNHQDAEIQPPEKRPAFISWWDYGFYEVAVGGHPTVADNFQDGIPPAANFHTSTSEKEGIAVWIVRLLEGDLGANKGEFSSEVIATLTKHLGENNTKNATSWMLNPLISPSFGTIIGEQYYDETYIGKKIHVGEQYPANAYYHDVTTLLNTTLDDEGITWLYHDIQQATGFSIRYYGVEGYDMDIFNVFTFLADKGTYGFATSEDPYFNTQYTDINGKTYSLADIEVLTTQQKRDLAPFTPQTIKKDAFYNTLVYRVYKGLKDQAYPTFGLRHFALKYISKFPYGNYPAVIIAKYYEGAYINGSISINNTPIPFVQSVVFDEFEAPHDYQFSDYDGNYSLLVPGGNITLRFAYYGEVPLKEITFNSTSNPLYAPITEEEAMRLTNYIRFINITVNTSTIEGYIYEDNNNNNSYDPGIDTPLSGVKLQMQDEYRPEDGTFNLTTDAQGHYITTGLFPSRYNISAIQNGFTLSSQSVIITPDQNYYNISKPKLAGVTGHVYYDQNNDKNYETGEEISNVRMDLLYTNLEGQQTLVNSITTDATGSFAFSSLVPGAYTLNATKRNTATGYLDYSSQQSITLAANQTLSNNLSITFAPITVSGHAAYGSTSIGGISLAFTPDASVANNTAQTSTITSNADGSYVAKIIPGTYNVTAQKKEGLTPVYSFTGHFTVRMGDGVKTYDIILIKESVTVSGATTSNGIGTANMTMYFSGRFDIENNTAIDTTAKSIATGMYTVELAPGYYDVNISEIVNENGQNVTYIFNSQLTIQSDEITTGKTFAIILTREESP